ncbi:HD domain-containing protein [Effusibacillus pohliae]|uniref:HD domain-containing protein n=1 Tax=Effusibacillus pohliae TaxID=232270 RepID=UPI000376BB98|nr:HD domain-containing protein [Effusibacillus pohliae]
MKTIRDPVHNIIQIDTESEKLLLDLIDTREFQRLRFIKQLGLSSFTYPGAEHTRFSHSLGVTHLMKRFIDKIGGLSGATNKKYAEELNDHRLLALAAALLHDIGHGPFSHALERTTGVRHEKWTIQIILGNTEINSILEKHRPGFAREVADVIQRMHASKAVVKLLSSQLDTDRIDYLLRDSKMTGAGYGSFDLEWLIHSLRIGEVNGEAEVGLDLEKGLSIAEDFVMARYYMYQNVYFHKTTRSAELLIDRIFERAVELQRDGQLELPDDLTAILEKGIAADTLDNFINLTESTIWHHIGMWQHHRDRILSDLCKRLMQRRLYKTILTDYDIVELSERVLAISKQTGIPHKYILFRDVASSSSYRDSYILESPKTEENETEKEASEQIFLFDRTGNSVELSQVSDLINLIRNKKISISRVYVPEEYKDALLGG